MVQDLRSNMLLFYAGIRRNSMDILGQQKTGHRGSLHCTKQLAYRMREALLAAGEKHRCVYLPWRPQEALFNQAQHAIMLFSWCMNACPNPSNWLGHG